MLLTSIFSRTIALGLLVYLSGGCTPLTVATPPDSPDVAAVATSAPRLSPRQFSVSAAAYVPVAGALVERKVAREVVAAQGKLFGNRAPLVNEVIRLAPAYFPSGARVLSLPETTDAGAVINLNAAFANPKFWQGRSRRDTQLAFHALARNVAFKNEPKGVPLPVRFLVEGKRVTKIGSFDTSRPLQPDEIIGVNGARQNQRQQSGQAH